MKPDIDTGQLNAFVDGELELSRQLEFEQRLKQDDTVRARVDGLRQLREDIRTAADYHTVPVALRQRLSAMLSVSSSEPRALVGTSTGVSSGGPSGAAPLRRRWDWRPGVLLPSLVTAMVLAVSLLWWRAERETRLMEEVVASHVRSTLGQHLVDVASSDRHTVKPWLSSKLDFSPPVHDLHRPGSTVLGARVDYLDGRPVAALAYLQGPHVVNVFVWPTEAADSVAQLASRKGFQLAHWSRRGMTHWVISDVNAEEFASLVRALQITGGEP